MPFVSSAPGATPVPAGTYFGALETMVDVGGGLWRMTFIGGIAASQEVLCFSTLPVLAANSGPQIRLIDDAQANTIFDTTRRPLAIRYMSDLTDAGQWWSSPINLPAGIAKPAIFATVSAVANVRVIETWNTYSRTTISRSATFPYLVGGSTINGAQAAIFWAQSGFIPDTGEGQMIDTQRSEDSSYGASFLAVIDAANYP